MPPTVPSVVQQNAAVTPPSTPTLPWRTATLPRVDTLSQEVNAFAAARVGIQRVIEGAGFLYGLVLDFNATGGAGGTTAAVYSEDAPWDAADSIVLSDVSGELVNLQGFNLRLCNIADGWNKTILPGEFASGSTSASHSQDTNHTANTQAVATSGNFRFSLRVPVGTNLRDAVGVVGNQDRAQRYQLRSDQAAASSVYATQPAPTLPTLTISKYYENFSVPLANAADGTPQQVLPPHYGTTHYSTQAVSETAPTPGTVPFSLRRIGNTIRYVWVVLRNGAGATPRATADANPPTTIRLKLGEDSIRYESYNFRRWRMAETLGFDAPKGCLLYDFISDFGPFVGFELGNDLIHSQALVNMRFELGLPAGQYGAGSTLTFVTDDLIYKQPQVAQVR